MMNASDTFGKILKHGLQISLFYIITRRGERSRGRMGIELGFGVATSRKLFSGFLYELWACAICSTMASFSVDTDRGIHHAGTRMRGSSLDTHAGTSAHASAMSKFPAVITLPRPIDE